MNIEGEYITLKRSSYDELKFSNEEIKEQVRTDFFKRIVLYKEEHTTENGMHILITLSDKLLKEEFANHLECDSAKVEIQIR
ncbi:hypothetical protein FHK07_12090 [Listeria monocytogenes]|nr:hypothetical protein [Listeria monocytogenes]EJM6842215.1 hypothetical protein [Listeria monocytogenes]